jgi:hypothetical protein
MAVFVLEWSLFSHGIFVVLRCMKGSLRWHEELNSVRSWAALKKRRCASDRCKCIAVKPTGSRQGDEATTMSRRKIFKSRRQLFASENWAEMSPGDRID